MRFVEKGAGNPTSCICELLIHIKTRERFFCPLSKYAAVVSLKLWSSHGIFKLKNKSGIQGRYLKDWLFWTHREDLPAHLQRLPSHPIFCAHPSSPTPSSKSCGWTFRVGERMVSWVILCFSLPVSNHAWGSEGKFRWPSLVPLHFMQCTKS